MSALPHPPVPEAIQSRQQGGRLGRNIGLSGVVIDLLIGIPWASARCRPLLAVFG